MTKNRYSFLSLIILLLLAGTIVSFVPHITEAYLKAGGTLVLSLGYFLITKDHPKKRMVQVFFMGSLFTLVGDLFLGLEKFEMGPTKDMLFIIGLGGFLVGYLLYGIAMLFYSFGKNNPWTSQKIIITIGAIGLSITLVVGLHSQFVMPEIMQVPVMLYLFQAVLLVAGGTAFHVQNRNKASLVMMISALMLFSSDCFIGIKLFIENHFWSEFAIMGTYILGQSGFFWALSLKGKGSIS